MSVSIWQTSNIEAPARAGTVVVGAGLIGAYLALRLREAGSDVAVLEARHVAAGASGRNGGLLLSGVAHNYQTAVELYGRQATRELWQATVCNREAMIGYASRLGTPVRRCGSLILASDERQADELRRSAELMRADDVSVTWHAHDPLERGFLAALEHDDDGAIQAALLTAALLRESGARLRDNAEVYGVESTADGVLLRVRGGDVLAQQVIFATNAWTPQLLPEFGSTIVPGRGQIFATAPAPLVLERAAYCDDGFVYFQQLPDGRFVLGGYRNLRFEEERTYADNTTPAIQSALEAFLARHFPELAEVPIERRWSGTMAFTPDGLPLVGRLRRDDRIAFGVAFNGHGLGLGLVVADELLALLARRGDGGMFDAGRLMGDAVTR